MIKLCMCGKSFKTYQSIAYRIKYCSFECRFKHRIRSWAKEKLKVICKCGKEFKVYPYRLSGKGNSGHAIYCSRKCHGKYGVFGRTKGIKTLNGSIAKLGVKNPMYGKKLSKFQKQKLFKGGKKYQDTIRVTKEHKRLIKKILDYKRKATIKGQFLPKEWEELKEKYHYTCPCCGRKELEKKLTIDHIIPLSKGGTNTIENIQPLCLSCNCKKNNRKIIKYEII